MAGAEPFAVPLLGITGAGDSSSAPSSFAISVCWVAVDHSNGVTATCCCGSRTDPDCAPHHLGGPQHLERAGGLPCERAETPPVGSRKAAPPASPLSILPRPDPVNTR